MTQLPLKRENPMRTEMPKFGLYNPSSLKMGEDGVMTVDFINSADHKDVQVIPISEAREAKLIRDVLEAQKSSLRCPLVSPGNMPVFVNGIVAMSKTDPREGVIRVPGTTERPAHYLPMKTAFDVLPGDLPEKGVCIARGYMDDGALIVSSIIVTPSPEQLVQPATQSDLPHNRSA